jgi:hypothetical protein
MVIFNLIAEKGAQKEISKANHTLNQRKNHTNLSTIYA